MESVMRIPLFLMLLAMTPVRGRAQEPVGQFGPYHWNNKQMRLLEGDTLTVYRVKYWVFNGADPALQLEYESPLPVTDTLGVKHLLGRIWPAFAPYVEHLHLHRAIVTATNLIRQGGPPAWTATFRSYGVVLQREPSGIWHIQNDTLPLPSSLGDDTLLIYEVNGKPMKLSEPPP